MKFKKILLIVGMLFLTSITYGQSVSKWRELTFSNTAGIGVNNSMFNQFSAALYYELPSNLAISTWNAINFQSNNGIPQNWASSQTLLLRQNKNQWRYGVGYQYGSGGTGLIPINTSQGFAVVHISKRFKL